MIMYWTDKTLFLRHYRKPPLYTKQLIMKAISIMEWGVPLHLVFGLFMISNPKAFVYDSQLLTTLPGYAQNLGEYF
jgi:hypothetical protein